MEEFGVQLLIPSGEVAKANCDYLQVPTEDGQLGILAGHTSILSNLVPGVLRLKGAAPQDYFISSAQLQFSENQGVILAEYVEEKHKIDQSRAGQAKERALEHLKRSNTGNTDIPRAIAALARANARLSLR